MGQHSVSFPGQGSADRIISIFSLLASPVLLATSTFFWQQGEYSTTSATLLIGSLFFWLAALKPLFSLTAGILPAYSVWGYWVACLGCISGICFAFLGYMAAVLNLDHHQYLAALNRYPFSSQLLLFATGPLFPLSIFFLGIQLLRYRLVPSGIAVLLIFGAIAFPLSRIPRIEWAAHLADLLLLIPCWYCMAKFLMSN